jgi:hypothetical protein
MNTNEVRDAWHLYRCTYGDRTNMFGRSPVYAQNTSWIRALEQALINAGHVYPPDGYLGSKRSCPSGIGGQKCEENGDNCSLHNYGLAWDLAYQYNPHLKRELDSTELDALFAEGKTTFNSYIVDEVSKVRTTGGERAFTWLGYSIGDLMHWQVNFPPEDQEIDWSTVGDNEPEDRPMTTEQWASTLRNPLDFQQMVDKGVITQNEYDYWITVPVTSPEFNDLRNAVEVRNPLWTK